MTQHFDYCQRQGEGDNESVRSSAPVVSRCFPGGYNVKLYISRGRLAWWLLTFLHSDCFWDMCERLPISVLLDVVLVLTIRVEVWLQKWSLYRLKSGYRNGLSATMTQPQCPIGHANVFSDPFKFVYKTFPHLLSKKGTGQSLVDFAQHAHSQD